MSRFSSIRFLQRLSGLFLLAGFSFNLAAEVTRIEIVEREALADAAVDYRYEVIRGLMHFALDPDDPGNSQVYDIQHVQVNAAGLVEFSADFTLMVPSENISNDTLLYIVNNRGGPSGAPGRFPDDPLYEQGFTWLLTGWINELEATPGRILLHAPLVGLPDRTISGPVRYEIITDAHENDVNIAGGGHLAYEPVESSLAAATLTHRVNQQDPRLPIERSQFAMSVAWPEGRNQPVVTLNVDGGFQPGHIYELIYEAQNPVLAGAGLAGIRDSVALMRHGAGDDQALAAQLESLGLPDIRHTIARGNSQSGRLLRLYLYDGFNADLEGRQVFDGVIPVIAGSGFGMFNNRFAMPTRTNGQHENALFPNDLFPFTYGISTDPFTGKVDGILRSAMDTGTAPKIMHIQTSNEYWVRGGSLPHTDPLGREDAPLPDNVRFYTIGGSQHGSGSGQPRPASGTQLPRNPNLWTPFSDSLLVAMQRWIADEVEPPPSRYPRIADGTLVSSHLENGQINPRAWNPVPQVNHPKEMYRVAHADYGPEWEDQRIIGVHPRSSDRHYGVMVPAVDANNNDYASSTILPPLTQVPLATFIPWNLRSPDVGAETELARLAGGYLPFPADAIAGLYRSFDDYLARYEAATDGLIEGGYLLPVFRDDFMAIALSNRPILE